MKEYYEEYWESDEAPVEPDRYAAARERLLLQVLPSNLTGISILDAGVGGGRLAAGLVERGAQLTGLDISETAIAHAARRSPGARFHVHSVEELPWPVEPECFDVVYALEVIEHLVRPRLLLEGAFAALEPGGKLALTTPHHGRLKNLALAVAGFDRHYDVEGYHLRFFSDRSLCRLVEDVGFRVERLSHYGRIPGLAAGLFVWAVKP